MKYDRVSYQTTQTFEEQKIVLHLCLCKKGLSTNILVSMTSSKTELRPYIASLLNPSP